MKYLYLSLCFALIACSDEPEALKSSTGIAGELSLEVAAGSVPADDYSYAEVSAVITGRRLLTVRPKIPWLLQRMRW
jgi:hypothetical protein